MTLDYPWPDAPQTGQLATLLAGISWVRMPLPFALNHVNLWWLDDGNSAVLFDAGAGTEISRLAWRSVLLQLRKPPEQLLISHYHPDHIGLASWFETEFATDVLITDAEWRRANGALSVSDEEFVEKQALQYRQHGLDENRLASLSAIGNSYLPLVPSLPDRVTSIASGQELILAGCSWTVMTCAGHAPDMICLYSESLNVLIAADQILPAITPNISAGFYTDDPDPLGSFLAAFDQFEHLPDDVLVLPSHGLPFRGLHQRIAQLRAHHRERLDTLVKRCARPTSAAAALPYLFERPLASEHLMFAMGESIAHLQHLLGKGTVEAQMNNDVIEFVALERLVG
jgi:glyoxylase-like metal-dependent hydrolase (beta-lactamase superfamily II)